jgi:hypothetical protein
VEKQQKEGEKIEQDTKEQLRLISDTITIEDEGDAIEKLEGEALETVEKYKREATRIVRSGCALHAEPKGSGAIAKLLELNPAFAMKPDDPQIVLVVYNVNTSGEAITNPSTRVPPLRAHYKKCMAGFMETRNNAPGVCKTDAYIFMDGGRHGNENEFLSAFKFTEVVKKKDKKGMEIESEKGEAVKTLTKNMAKQKTHVVPLLRGGVGEDEEGASSRSRIDALRRVDASCPGAGCQKVEEQGSFALRRDDGFRHHDRGHVA